MRMIALSFLRVRAKNVLIYKFARSVSDLAQKYLFIRKQTTMRPFNISAVKLSPHLRLNYRLFSSISDRNSVELRAFNFSFQNFLLHTHTKSSPRKTFRLLNTEMPRLIQE